MSTNIRAKRKGAKRQTSVSSAEAGLKSARRVFAKFLEKADPLAAKPSLKRN
jgi:hypothetical protein